MAEAFPISGSIDPKAFPFLLMQLHRQGATGSLKVDGPSYQKALYFRGGRVLFGSSNDPRDQLGAILIESGKITPEQLEDVNAKVGPGSPLAKVLSDTGFVSQRELSEAARAKVERILSDMLGYASGSFEFEDSVLPKGAVDLKLSTERLVLAAVSRISDRNFVLRHFEGLDVVLAHTPAMESHIAEIMVEAGGLPDQLDGRRSLKEAASRTRLDEFEAAKVACALMFLGLVTRPKGAEPGPAVEEPDVFVVPEAADGLLDLGATAAQAMEPDPVAQTISDRPALGKPPLAAPEVAFAEARVTEPEPAPTVLLPPKRLPEPGAPDPVTERRPAVKVTPAPWKPPAPVSPRPMTSARPSKEDLAALDELLNSRSLEGPLAPFEKPAAQERWSPQFGQKPGPRTARRHSEGGRQRVLVTMGIVLALAVIVGGGWLYRTRPPGGTVAAVTPPRTASPGPASPIGGSPPAVIPSAPVSTTIVPASIPTPAAPRSPVGAPPPKQAAGGSPADARSLLRSGSLPAAAQVFAGTVRGAARGSATIQLFIACSPETVQKAVDAVRADELFIVPVSYQGRDCYRLGWGLYPSEAGAASALRSLPDYFRKGGAAPRVMPTAEILR